MPEKITFFESYYRAAEKLPESDRDSFIAGLLAYVFDGVEPSFEGVQDILFTAIRPNLDHSLALSQAGKKGAKATNENATREPRTKPEQPAENEAVTQAESGSRNGQPKQGAESGGLSEERIEVGKGKEGFGSPNQNQNPPSPNSTDGDSDAALPKGAALTDGIAGEVKFDDPPSKEASADISVIREQLSAVQAGLSHDPSNDYFAREVQRLKARLHRLETKGVRR